VDDFFGVLIFIVLTVPVTLFVMLYLLLDRQKLSRDEFKLRLDKIEAALRDQRKLLQELSKPAEIVAVAEDSPPPLFEARGPAVEQVFLQEQNQESCEAEVEAVETASVAAPRIASDEAWKQNQWLAAEPSRFELAAKKILAEIWNWIIVGQGHRQEGVAIEYAVASNWLLRIGVLILVTGIGFFLKYSIDNGLLGEHARVALSLLAGVGMIVGGVRLVGGQYHLFSQGLLGGGIAVLYFSVFAAFSFYHLLEVYPTFALMIVITACAAGLAVSLDSMLVAIFAIIGGFCTPILLSTGEVNFVGLFSYMLLLGSGILAINWYKQWHLLNFLAFFFNYLLFFGAMQRYELGYFWQVLPFLTGFFVLYSTAIFLFCLVNRAKSTLLDLLALIINAAIFFATAYYLIEMSYGHERVAVLTVGLAAFYVGHVYYCLVRRVEDRELLVSFIGLAAFFVTITLPLLLSKQWITVSWSVQALVMLWMSGKLRSAFLQQLALLLYGFVLLRLCLFNLPGQYGLAMDAEQPFTDFLFGLLERVVSFGIPIASLALAFKLIEKPVPASTLAYADDKPAGLWLNDNRLLQMTVICAAGLLFIVLQLELYRSFGYLYPPLQLPVLTLVWLAMGWLLLLRYLATARAGLLSVFCVLLIGLAVKLLLFDLPSWGLSLGRIADGDDVLTLRYSDGYSLQWVLMRLLDFAAIIGFLLFAFRRLAGADEAAGNIREWLGGVALLLLFMFLSLEVNSMLYQYVPGLRSGGVSILWSVFALTLVYNGIKRRISILRLLGLALFALVAWKVFFIDLARLEQLYRILAFIVLGMLALGGAFFYMRYQQSFIGDGESS